MGDQVKNKCCGLGGRGAGGGRGVWCGGGGCWGVGWIGWFGEKVEKVLSKCIATSFNET